MKKNESCFAQLNCEITLTVRKQRNKLQFIDQTQRKEFLMLTDKFREIKFRVLSSLYRAKNQNVELSSSEGSAFWTWP